MWQFLSGVQELGFLLEKHLCRTTEVISTKVATIQYISEMPVNYMPTVSW